MTQRGSLVVGLLLGGLVLALGLAMIFTKDWVWSLFELLYGMLDIQAERTSMWEKFISTIGLFVTGAGLHILWSVLPVRQHSASDGS